MPLLDPLVVFPIYRSSSTTDWTRLAIACLVHPLLYEIVMTAQRLRPPYINAQHYEIALKDERRHYYPLTKLGSAFMLEQIFTLYRRAMIGIIRDPSAVVLAVAFTALEEAIIRSTMVIRDTWVSRLLGYPEKGDEELAMQRKSW